MSSPEEPTSKGNSKAKKNPLTTIVLIVCLVIARFIFGFMLPPEEAWLAVITLLLALIYAEVWQE